MKKYISLAIAGLLTVGVFSVCETISSQAAENGKIQIVTTIFPEYDWVMNILGDNPAEADVTMLLDNGVDLHSFQPTVEDILKISTCDLFIYVGGESDEWVNDVLDKAMNKDMIVINLLDVLGDFVKEEELVEGMQEHEHDHDHDEEEHDDEEQNEEDHNEEDHSEEDHNEEDHSGEDHNEEDHSEEDHSEEGSDEDHGEDHDHDHDHEDDETEYDEHVWLSLKNAVALVANISEAIQKIDPDNAAAYKENTTAYMEKLSVLDEEYQAAVSDASVTTLLFGDRFPFRYMVDDYGLSYYAAFSGCSAESEASFETITFLASKVDELSLSAVMTIEGTDHRIAETIVQTTQAKDQKILTMDSMQSTTAKDVENGVSYLDIMEKNLSVLKEALK